MNFPFADMEGKVTAKCIVFFKENGACFNRGTKQAMLNLSISNSDLPDLPWPKSNACYDCLSNTEIAFLF